MTCGAVNALATIAAAVCLRTPLIGIRCSRPPALGAERPLHGGAVAVPETGGVDVGAGDHAAVPAAGDRGQVDAEVLGVLAHRRLGQRAQPAAPVRRAVGGRRSPAQRVRLGLPADLEPAVPHRLGAGVGRGGQQRRAVGPGAVVGSAAVRRWRGRRPASGAAGTARASVFRGP